MKFAWLGCLLLGSLLFAGTPDSDINVNSRYTVDAVVLAGKGWKTTLVADQTEESPGTQKLSTGLVRELRALIGQKLNPGVLDGLADRLRRELAAREVTHHLLRGSSPERVQVEFEVRPARGSVDLRATQFTYNSREGWSGGGEVGVTVHQNSLAFGLISDGDSLPERYTGVTARYDNHHLGTDRLNLRFVVESYHTQWDNATVQAVEGAPNETAGLYRSRQNFQPTAVIVLAKPLTLEVGTSFQRYESETPGAPVESSNALITTVRYHRQMEGADSQQDLDAAYSLRAATRALNSDFIYTRNYWFVRYQLAYGKHMLMDELRAGLIDGTAPLNERFVLGNTTTLRGWNKYDLDPIGGNRLVSNSVEYRYGVFKAFYDTGAIWDAGQPVTPRQSVGVGLKESVFTLAVAFPIKSGRVEPIFMMGFMY
jgi:hypothetical protein